MKLKMAENSLFAILLRSPWWISVAIALVMGLLGFNLLPAAYRLGGALSGLPFVVIAVISARRQWHLPSAVRVSETGQAVAAMAWPAFAALLEQAFERDGYTVRRGETAGNDFDLERRGRRMLISARRWKAARIGLETLRALQAAREAAEAPDAMLIALGEVSDNALQFAKEHSIVVWRTAEVAQLLRGLALRPARPVRPR